MKKNKIAISIFAVMCVISIVVGYSLIKQNENHKYDQLAVMVRQDNGSYVRSSMSIFGNDDYELDHAVCNNGSTVTANSNGGVNLKLLGTEKCTVYLKKIKTVIEKIKESTKTTAPDFTQISPKYVPGENLIVNHIYDGYTKVEHNLEDYSDEFIYNESLKQWEAPTYFGSEIEITFSINENKRNMALCYEAGFNGKDTSIAQFYKNGVQFYNEIFGGEACIRLGNLTMEDSLKVYYYAQEEDTSLNEFNFYLVDDYTINNTGSEVYPMKDDYGTSYYYRGIVEDNYVKFGDYIWRIVRINGDNSLRIIYDGTTPHANGEPSLDRALPIKIKFNDYHNNSTYIGYMYGDVNGTTYNSVHANTHDSTIKKYLDSWYETNIKNKGLSGYISDILFCNDRSISSGTGVGTTSTNYGANTRANNGEDPILTCPQKKDAFTVNDTEHGNGALKYPIGLLTADEYRLAGNNLLVYSLSGYLNKPGVNWWLGSPYFSSNYASEFHVSFSGSLYGEGLVTHTYLLAPVINLTPEAANQLRGSGTMNDPYTIK